MSDQLQNLLNLIRDKSIDLISSIQHEKEIKENREVAKGTEAETKFAEEEIKETARQAALYDDLNTFLQTLSLVAKQEKREEIATNALLMLEELNKSKRQPRSIQFTDDRTRAVQNIVRLSLEGKFKEPGETVLLNTLAVLVAAFDLKVIQRSKSCVVALLVTPGHEKIYGANLHGETEMVKVPLVRHAEIIAILDARKKNYRVEGSTIFISDIPCYWKNKVRFTERSEKEIKGVIEYSNDERFLEPKFREHTWEKRDGTYYYRNLGVEIVERFTSENESVVYYNIDNQWIPRELRYYKDNKKYVWIESGCAVTLALLGLKEVFYVFHEPMFEEGIELMGEKKVEVLRVKHDDLEALAALAKHANPKNVQEMDTVLARLSFRLRLDIKQNIREKFKEPLASLT